MSKPARYTAKDLATMRRLRAEGQSLRQIGKAFGCPHVYILFKTRPPTRQTQSDARSVTPGAG